MLLCETVTFLCLLEGQRRSQVIQEPRRVIIRLVVVNRRVRYDVLTVPQKDVSCPQFFVWSFFFQGGIFLLVGNPRKVVVAPDFPRFHPHLGRALHRTPPPQKTVFRENVHS